MSTNKKTHKTNRDSETGQFVTKEYAKDHPKTTETETIANPGQSLNRSTSSTKRNKNEHW